MSFASPASSNSIEMLELRRLLSSATLRGHTLVVNGDNDADNTIIISLNDAGDNVQVNIDTAAAQFFTLADVKRIIVRGRNGDDTLGVDESRGGLGKILVYMDGGDGKDDIGTGLERDIIRGGRGDDAIHDAGGNNIVDGGDGIDNIITGDGNDWISGGRGDDVIDAFNGRNRVFGGAGNDVIGTGAGNDFIDGGRGNDQITSNAGDDRLFGGAGDDILDAGDGNDRLFAGSGADQLRAGAGDDTLTGSGTADTLDGGDGTNTIHDTDDRPDAGADH